MKGLALILSCIAAAAQPSVKRVVPLATDTSVKIEVTLAEGASPASLTARITSCADHSVLWQGSVGNNGVMSDDSTYVCTVSGLSPRLWSPSTPWLYDLSVISGNDTCTVRTGFRLFRMKDGNFYLNGAPVFLRGNAINPPGRGIPAVLEGSKDFARDYVRFLKGMNVNIIRIPNNQNWLDVCDEEGMMVFGGRYGRPRGGSKSAPPADLDSSVIYYKEHELGPLASHPSAVIYVLSNEMPSEGRVGAAYREFLSALYGRLKSWDDTRQYIGNAGYGLGRSADIYDVHRYWGWYYNSYLTYLNLRDTDMWQNPGRTQAVTFSECVGNYTGIDGRFNLCSRTKQPGSQKCWTGHVPQSGQAEAALEYQAFVLKNATEMFRRMRCHNPRLSGLMPFTILFHNWDGIQSFAQMKPKPAAYQYGESYQPVLLSWELWQYNAKGGGKVDVVAHVVNDDDLFRPLGACRLEWTVEDVDRKTIVSGVEQIPPVAYYSTFRRPVSFRLPELIQPGEYRLCGVLLDGESRIVSTNSVRFFAAPASWSTAGEHGRVQLYDPSGLTSAAFDRMGLRYELIGKISRARHDIPLVIGEDALVRGGDTRGLRALAESGCRIVCLRQRASEVDYSWIDAGIRPLKVSNNDPTYLSPEYAYVDGMNINVERRSHPVFSGLDHRMMRLWADYTGFDESKPGFPQVYPVTDGFSLRGVDLGKVSVLADYSRGLSAAAMAQFEMGRGFVLLSAFDLCRRAGIDPVAEKMLCNIVDYACSDAKTDPYRPVGNVIEWGSYESEDGLVSGALNGMVLNPYPVVPRNRVGDWPLKVDSRGYHYVVSYGGWNTRPGVQYVPRGRRPFAPFNYSPGGNDVLDDGAEGMGEACFLAKAPEGAASMFTTFENNAMEDIDISISLNGSQPVWYVVPAGRQLVCETELPQDGRIRVGFKGDRRTVILRTEFR